MTSFLDSKQNLVARLKDPKFYLENFCKIKTKRGGLEKFILKEAQKDLYNTLMLNNRVIILKARQMGFSTAVTGFLYHSAIMNPGTNTALIGYNAELTTELLDKVKTFWRTTPSELRPTIHYNSKYEISFPKIDSKIIVLPSTENVGRGYTLHRVLCLSGDTNVYKRNGESVKIKNLEDGTEILNGVGSYSKIKKVIKRKNNELMTKISSYGCDPIFLTKEHKILVRDSTKSKWVKAGDLKTGDYYAYPYFQLRDKNKVVKINNNIKEGYESRSFKLDEVKIDRNFGEFCGWYIAEGTGGKEKINLSVHKKEVGYVTDLIEKSIVDYIKSYSVCYSKNSDTAIFSLYGKQFACFLEEYFGSRCENKKIDDRTWRWNWEFGYGLLKGIILGDGYLKNKKEIRIVTVSERLSNQIKRLMVSLRIGLPTIKYSDTKRYGVKGKRRYDIFLGGKGNYKLRRKLGFELPIYDSWRAWWRRENTPWVNQGGGYWKRGKFFYWGRISKVENVDRDKVVYDIILEKEPHSFVANGMVVHNCTELSAWERAEEKMMSLEASVPIDGKIIIESTPRGTGNLYHRMWVNDKSDYVKKEYGWWWEYSPDEIEKIRKRMNNEQAFAQEYGLEFLTSGRPVFDQKKLRDLRKNILNVGDIVPGTDYNVEEIEGLRIYRKVEEKMLYVMGIDTSEGVSGGDYSVVTIINRMTGEEVAMYRGLIAPDRLGAMVNKWGRAYNNALAVVEINNHGLTTQTILKQLSYPCLYYRPKQFETIGTTYTDKLGWRTTKLTRVLLIDDLAQAIREDTLTIHSKEILDEMTTFVYDANNEMVPQESFHDDCIFATGIALQGFKILYKGELTQINVDSTPHVNYF